MLRTLPSRLSAMHSERTTLRLALLLICCSTLCIWPNTRYCRADSPADEDAGRTLHIRFFSLRPGHTIGASQLILHADGTVEFSIEQESVRTDSGTWNKRQNRFSAAVHFTVDRHPACSYRLLFEGYHLTGLHAGRARLREYDRRDRLTQEVLFLFYAVPPGRESRAGSFFFRLPHGSVTTGSGD